jgi:hypothetical protein
VSVADTRGVLPIELDELTLPRAEARGFQTYVAVPSWPSPGPVSAGAYHPARGTHAGLTSRQQVATAEAETPAPRGTPRRTFAGPAAACTALAGRGTEKGHTRLLRLTERVWQQIKQRPECSSVFVTSTTSFCGLWPHRELARWANARLTPYLKKGGYASGLLRTASRATPAPPGRMRVDRCAWRCHRG